MRNDFFLPKYRNHSGVRYLGKEVMSMSEMPNETYEESQRERILSLIAVCGELPADQISRLPGGERYKLNMIQQLKKRRQIKTFYKDGLRGYRLLLQTKEQLLEKNPDRFTFFLTGVNETNHIRSEITRRLRLHRLAETTVTMLNGGVEFYRDSKPDVFAPSYTPTEITSPSFYNSREIKELGIDTIKINGARAMGVLLTETEVFPTYNLGDSMIEWDYKAEMRFKAMMQTTICQNRLKHQYSGDSISGLLLGNSMEFAAVIFRQTRDKEYFIFDGGYDHFYYLTNDRKGELLLSVLCYPDIRQTFYETLTEDFSKGDSTYPVENDAIDKHGNPVLIGCTCDLPRIKRFVNAIESQKRKGTIVGFDYQKDVLGSLCPERIHFQDISFEKWERNFFHEG